MLSDCIRERGRDVSVALRVAGRGSRKGRSKTRSAGRRARIADVMIQISSFGILKRDYKGEYSLGGW